MPLIGEAVVINAVTEIATTPTREWGVPIILSNDGYYVPIQKETPIGVDTQPSNITGITIDGASMLSGISTGAKTLNYIASGYLLSWDGGTAVDASANTLFKLYDSGNVNYILISTVPANLPTTDQNDTITLQNSILANQITIDKLNHKADCVLYIKDVSEASCSLAGTHPRPTSAGNYTLSSDGMEIAIKNNKGSKKLYEKLANSHNVPQLYYPTGGIGDDYGIDTKLYAAAQAVFRQGVRKLYILNTCPSLSEYGYGYGGYGEGYSGYGAPSSSPPTDWAAALANITPYADNGIIMGAMIAGITRKNELVELKTWCDANNIIFTATNADSDSISDITTAVSELASANGFFLARKESTEDIAAVALGRLMTLKPWITAFWKSLNASITSYFPPDEVDTLDTNKANVVALIASANRISNGLTTSGDPKFIDVTRTKYYAIALVKAAIASLRLKMEMMLYNNRGLERIKTVITKSMEEMVLVGALREHKPEIGLPAYQIVMPQLSAISDTDKTNRELKNVYIKGWLSGDIHTFELNLVFVL